MRKEEGGPFAREDEHSSDCPATASVCMGKVGTNITIGDQRANDCKGRGEPE